MTTDTRQFVNPRFPPDHTLEGREAMALIHGYQYLLKHFQKYFSGKIWPIEKYSVCVNYYKDFNYIVVSFIPITETFIDGVPFEIADRGMYKNGPGTSFFLDPITYELLRFHAMR